jgi:hypothetical protein
MSGSAVSQPVPEDQIWCANILLLLFVPHQTVFFPQKNPGTAGFSPLGVVNWRWPILFTAGGFL